MQPTSKNFGKHITIEGAKAAGEIVPEVIEDMKKLLGAAENAGPGVTEIILREVTAAIGETAVDVLMPFAKIAKIAWKIHSAIKTAKEKAVAEANRLYREVTNQIVRRVKEKQFDIKHDTASQDELLSLIDDDPDAALAKVLETQDPGLLNLKRQLEALDAKLAIMVESLDSLAENADADQDADLKSAIVKKLSELRAAPRAATDSKPHVDLHQKTRQTSAGIGSVLANTPTGKKSGIPVDELLDPDVIYDETQWLRENLLSDPTAIGKLHALAKKCPWLSKVELIEAGRYVGRQLPQLAEKLHGDDASTLVACIDLFLKAGVTSDADLKAELTKARETAMQNADGWQRAGAEATEADGPVTEIIDAEFEKVVAKMSALAERNLETGSRREDESAMDTLPSVPLDGFLTITVQRQLPAQKDAEAETPVDSLYFHYSGDRKPSFTLQRHKTATSGPWHEIRYKGIIMYGSAGSYANDSSVISELRDVIDILDRMLAVKSGEISLLPGHTAHEWRVARSRQRHVHSPDMSARVLVEEALACVDASMIQNIPNPTENHSGFEQGIINGTMQTGSRTITFRDVLIDMHHRWVANDSTGQIPAKPAVIEIREGSKNITIRNENDRLTYSVTDAGKAVEWNTHQYGNAIFDACEDMVSTSVARQMELISRYVKNPSTVSEADVSALLEKMSNVKAKASQGTSDLSVSFEKESCIHDAGEILHALSKNPGTHQRSIETQLGALLASIKDFCESSRWRTSYGFFSGMQIIQSIDRLLAGNALSADLVEACKKTRTAVVTGAAEAVSGDAEESVDRSASAANAEQRVPHYRTLLYALDATGVRTDARGNVNNAFHNGKYWKKINAGLLMDRRIEDDRLRV